MTGRRAGPAPLPLLPAADLAPVRRAPTAPGPGDSGPADRAAGYASVAVDAGGRATDRLFTYRVPSALAARVRPGARVQVPFAGLRAPAAGVVLALSAATDLPPERVRPILAAPDEEPALREVDLELAAWLAERAVCTLAQALRVLLPPPGVAPRTLLVYLPAGSDAPRLLRAAPRQLAAWRAIAAEPGLTAAELGRRGASPVALATLVRRGLATATTAAVRRDPFGAEPGPSPEPPPPLTEAQERALAALGPALDGPTPGAFLLWGVTGSGKTEVYLRAIAAVLAAGRQAIVLVPEIALTPQTVHLFRRRFPARVAVLHSALGAGERHDEWWRIRRGEVAVAVGARSAVFAPFPRLGLIVVDEEHEPSYKQEEAPRYHARDAALERGRAAGIPVLLGSATPDVETFAAAARGDIVRLDLPERVAGRPLPAVMVVDQRDGPRDQDGEGLFSPELRAALQRHLQAGRQALLFLNRRGFAPVLLCGACGFAARCQACDVALCYHASDRMLHCHYCAARRAVPRVCPRCGGHLLRLRGSGTERVAAEVERVFPGSRVLRMDLDTTATKGAHGRIYEDFRAGRADVLVGTQMVAKGWDVAGVTLVGVIDADTGLHHPDYRGAERTFQLLCQVAGRAGRGATPGEVLIQTRSPDHAAVTAAAAHDYAAFAAQELAIRRVSGFPPYSRLLRAVAWAPAAADAQAAAVALHGALAGALPPNVDLWGPAEAPLALLRGQHRWHLCLRGPDGAALRDLARAALAAVEGGLGNARVAVDPDPMSML